MNKSDFRRSLISIIISTGLLSFVPQAVSQNSTSNMAFDGQWPYETHCASCHGKNGEGIYPFGVGMKGSPLVQNSPPSVIINVIQNGRYNNVAYPEYSAMPAFDFIRAGQARAIVEYIKTDLQE